MTGRKTGHTSTPKRGGFLLACPRSKETGFFAHSGKHQRTRETRFLSETPQLVRGVGRVLF